MNNVRRINELDGLRGLAAMSVVLFHFTTHYDYLFNHAKEPYFLNFKYGYLGVQLFFIISGFVIFMTLKTNINLKDFAIKRAMRLYPAYVFCVALTFTVVALYQLDGLSVNLKDGLLNLTMLQGFIPGVEHIDGSYWSLTVEITFYILMGFFFKLKLLKRIDILVVLWLSTSFLIKVVNQSIQSSLLQLLDSLLVFGYGNLFIAGIMFFQLKNENKLRYHLILTASLAYEFYFNGALFGIAVLVFFLLFYAILCRKLKFLSNKLFVFFGTISYSLYLVHQNIGYIIINFLEKQGFTNEMYIVIPILISIGIASLVTFYIEHPIQKMIRNRRKLNLESTKKVDVSSGIYSE